MKQLLVRFWRFLRRRCVLCGAKRVPRNPNDIHSFGPYCRRCNKTRNYASGYGMGRKKLAELIARHG